MEISGSELSYFGLSRWRMNRRDITSHHTHEAGSGLYVLDFLVLIPKDPAQPKRSLGFWFYENPVFHDWLANGPEIGSAAGEVSEPATPAPAPHPTPVRYRDSAKAKAPHIPDEELRTRLQWGVYGLNGIYGVLYLCWLFMPVLPVWLPFMIFVPPMIALRLKQMYPDQIRFTDEKTSADKRISICSLFYIPCFFLALMLMISSNFADIWSLELVVALLTVVLATFVLHWEAELRINLKRKASVWLFALGGAYALTNITDTVPDRGNFTATVTRIAHLEEGKHTYCAEVQPISDRKSPTRFYIRGNFYNHLSIGEKVCVRLHPGTIGIRWYSLSYCCKNL